jgi:hypothetical protein
MENHGSDFQLPSDVLTLKLPCPDCGSSLDCYDSTPADILTCGECHEYYQWEAHLEKMSEEKRDEEAVTHIEFWETVLSDWKKQAEK